MDKTGRWKRSAIPHQDGLTLEPELVHRFNMLDPVVGQGDTVPSSRRKKELRQALSITTTGRNTRGFFDNYGRPTRRWARFRRPLRLCPPAGRNEPDSRTCGGRQGYAPGSRTRSGCSPKRDIPMAATRRRQAAGDLLRPRTESVPAYQARLDWQAKQFAKLGVQSKCERTTTTASRTRMRKVHAQVYFWGWFADYPDPENFCSC